MNTGQLCGRWAPATLTTVALLAACSDRTPIAPPNASPAAPSYLVSTAPRGHGPRHVVVLRDGKTASDLAAAVAARGGTVDWSDADIGVVTASGLSEAAAAELSARSDVEGIDRDVVVQWLPPGERFSSEAIEAPAEAVPPVAQADQSSAAFFAFYQWNMRQIKADVAWTTTNAGAGALVCILDTGIDPDHLDLSGKVDVAKSTSFVAAEPFLDDLNTHGTAVASLVSSNGIAMASVAPEARLCAVKVLDGTGSGSFADVIAGIMHAARVGADVINMSLGAYFSLKEPGAKRLVRAIQRAVFFATGKGVLVVVAAGNDGVNLDKDPRDLIEIPGQLLGVVSVGATAPFDQTKFDALATYTNYGRSGIKVMAPGGDLLPGGQVRDLVIAACSHFQTALPFACTARTYILGAGTSFSSPHAAGTAAVVESQRRGDQFGLFLGLCLELGADDLGRRGFDPLYGFGRINVLGATKKCGRHSYW
jgi:lantibiotic leader peptide-processing serine protease